MSNATSPRFLIASSIGFLLMLSVCSNMAYAQDGLGALDYYNKIVKENQSKFILIVGLLIVAGLGTGFFLFFGKRKKQATVK